MNKLKNIWLRFVIYTIILVVVNLVSSTLFFRLDLTENKIYSLSNLSINTVASLKEPLTIKAFISENLPQPYNNLELELRDLLEEYSLKGNTYFNYEIYGMDKDGSKTDNNGTLLSTLAQNYGISSVRIQSLHNNEVSLIDAFMGLVVLQGDRTVPVSTLGTEQNLEYELTSIITDMVSKTNKLLSLEENLEVKLVFSSVLGELGQEYKNYSSELSNLINQLNKDYFNRINYKYIDPELENTDSLAQYKLPVYAVNDGVKNRNVNASMIISNQDDFILIDLIESTLFGDRIKAVSDLEQPITDSADRLLGVQASLGYASGKGEPARFSNPYAQQQSPSFGNFNQLLSASYNIKDVDVKKIPKGLKTLVIAGPKESYSDWELFQIDQFIMNGGSVAFFLDPFNEIMPQGQQQYYGAQPSYMPINTGLNKLLSHYGVDMQYSYIMDENAYVNRQQDQNGGIIETKIPFIPEIDKEDINDDFVVTKNIKGLIMMTLSPLVYSENLSENKKITTLFSSSPKAWEMKEQISLNPQTIFPPSSDEQKQFPLAAIIEGSFESYFSELSVPEAPINEEETEENSPIVIGQNTSVKENFKSNGDHGKIFVIGTSAILGDNILDVQGQSPNAMMIQNVIDYLNGKEEFLKMRSKGLSFNPIRGDISNVTKTFAKSFSIIGVPMLVIIFGLIMWVYLNRRKQKIKEMFKGVK